MSLKVLLVGGGLTSSLISSLLKKTPAALQIWDKARGAGGRMSTSRSPSDGTCTADLGAQYITATPSYLSNHNDFYNMLLMSKTLEPLNCRLQGLKEFPEGTRHFVAPGGTSSIVKHFFAEGGHEVYYEHHIEAIDLQEDSKWLVKTKSGKQGIFDAVVLTMPVPQILQLGGQVKNILEKNREVTENMKKVKYSSRYALGLFFESSAAFQDQGWDAKYLSDHKIFRYVALDSKKRQRDAPVAAVFHTSIDFGQEYIDKDAGEVQRLLLFEVKQLFPNWPEPKHVKCQKWRFSQVLDPYPGAPGCVQISSSPLLLAAGDGFVHSNFDGCVSSSLSAMEALTEYLSGKL